ncbi:unnamed protein product [Blepharisma stoltei]|uniref:Coatomer subunit beta n=1 Tax=Blepharisma stoltei TaxID=1481888 RepID=A0AAU9IUQ2_9CILI|nr:unnamed protein product [Blepharisma stoltei]
MPEQTKPCYLIIDYEVLAPPTSQEISKILQQGTEEEKIDAMKTLILMILQDDHYPRMIMTIVQHAMRAESKDMKKLLLLYWEAIEKTNHDGTIKDEMVMLCNALRNDLLSPNEFVRAKTLRLVAKMKYREMMDSLLQPVVDNLTHRHPYVRRNAVMCVYSIYMAFGDSLLPDAVEKVDELLKSETDLSTRRNALLFLFEAEPNVAMKYLNTILADEEENSSAYGSSADILQLVVLDELKRVCKANPQEKGRHIKAIFQLANSSKSQSVLYECASTLMQLTKAPNAVKLSISTYIKLLNDPSADNNVKLLVLEKLVGIKEQFPKLLQEQAVDLLRSLSSPSNDIRKKCLDLVLGLLSSRNVEEIVRILKKELLNVQSQKEELPYQELLIISLHKCAVSFPDITGQLGLVEVLMDCCLLQASTSAEVASFIQQLMSSYQSLQNTIIDKLHHIFAEISSAQVHRTALWMLSEYTRDPAKTIVLILNTIGEGPFINKRERIAHTEVAKDEQDKIHRTVILPDGTYGTQIISSSDFSRQKNVSGLRKLLTEIEEVDFFLATAISVSLTKLLFKIEERNRENYKQDILLMLCGLVQLRTYPLKHKNEKEYSEVPYSIDPDNFERIVQCIQTLTGMISPDWLEGGKELYSRSQNIAKQIEEQLEEVKQISQPDDLIPIKQLRGREGISDMDFIIEEDSFKAIFQDTDEEYSKRISRVRQLTGLGDPVYVECMMRMHLYDIVLEFSVFNRSSETIQNLTLELASQGDLKMVEKPLPINLAPGKSAQIKASVKVSSSEAGRIFGNLTYDSPKGGNLNVITLNEITIDAIEYIHPATCSESQFRQLWQEFKWESPVNVASTKTNLLDYIQKLSKISNVNILTPENAMLCSEHFLVCNMYGQSRFAEDALMNVSIERKDNGIIGSIRVRAKTQGMAKCIGERVGAIIQHIK